MSARKRRQLPDWLSICKVQKCEEKATEDCQNGNISFLSNGDAICENGYKEKRTETLLSSDVNSHKQEGKEQDLVCKPKEERQAIAAAEFQEKFLNGLPEMKFSGSLIYSFNKNDCNILCEEIQNSDIESNGSRFVGFDMEWPVSYRRGHQDPVAVLQICAGPVCYIFHLSTIGSIPSQLNKLLKNDKIKKVGVAIESDFWKLERDYDISVQSVIKNSIVDLSQFANRVLKSSENWSLDGLTRYLFKRKLNKDPNLRKSDWAHYPLSDCQKMYAATDAYVSYKIFERLRELDKKNSS